jgi:hypothetical protein
VRRRLAARRSIAVILFLAFAAAGAAAPASAQNGEGAGNGGRAFQETVRDPLKEVGASLRWLAHHAPHPSPRAAAQFMKNAGVKLAAPLHWLAGQLRAASADQDRAREAVRNGQIVPLASVLKTVQKTVPGDVLKVSLNHNIVGTWNYKITVLTPQGYYRDVDVDAGSNSITGIKEH